MAENEQERCPLCNERMQAYSDLHGKLWLWECRACGVSWDAACMDAYRAAVATREADLLETCRRVLARLVEMGHDGGEMGRWLREAIAEADRKGAP